MSDRQHAEHVREELIGFDIVLMFDFIFESVEFVQIFGLMIASGHEEVFGIKDLPSAHSHDNFNRKRTSIDEISVEQVRVFSGRVSV
jgi:hypothetical protein